MTAVLAAAASLVVLALAVELLLRLMGFSSFPLFEPDEASVYRMRPDQRGRFMRRHAWNYDANGMRNDRVRDDFVETTVLVGDSIVDGGLRIDQSETLAAQAARLSDQDFYSVACHGWALANVLAALRALPGWAGAKRLVFVLNTGDFHAVARLENQLSFPTRRPIWLALWIARRQLYRRVRFFRRFGQTKNTDLEQLIEEAETTRASNLAGFQQLLAEYSGPILLMRYPMRGEDARTELYFEQLASLDPRIRILEVAEAADWSADCYADHIHPNARGVTVLARHLCQGLS